MFRFFKVEVGTCPAKIDDQPNHDPFEYFEIPMELLMRCVIAHSKIFSKSVVSQSIL
jgi:hypothetical protein